MAILSVQTAFKLWQLESESSFHERGPQGGFEPATFRFRKWLSTWRVESSFQTEKCVL